MAESQGPPVYVVDTHATRPPLPPRTDRRPKRGDRTQTVLVVLVSLALFGLFAEACFIYYLHQSEAAASPSSSKQTGGAPPTRPPKTAKPVAHLTGGVNSAHGWSIMVWSHEEPPILEGIEFRDKSLIIQKEGFYYVYSKVFFSDSGTFYHCVETSSTRYRDGKILLKSRKYSPESETTKSNSFLGGVFHFDKDDSVYVTVNDTQKIRRHTPQENVFGAYMI
ncbi:tumor necrosis factor ligand superfamily member 14 isoform X2 [Salarias fasciatus]|uniref:Tumor necrosis factor ligand superfamily member 14-like n=2 Tax=Salarias fasciatus TaxID=181472 RepID=A0A672IBH5_SALFA|nr:tumor necrosis factor ligand superfamily member 14-like isoform X2 [Salarias fasciatus]